MNGRVLAAITALALMISAPALFAGGKQEAQPAAAQKVTELVVWGPGGTSEAFWQWVMEEFQKRNPSLKVRYDTPLVGVEISQALQKIRLSVQSGAGPDMALTDAVGQALREIVATGNVLTLDEAYTQYKWNGRIYTGAIDSITIDQKKMAVSIDIEVVGTFYNNTAFQKAGVSPPKTMEEYITTLKKLTQAGYAGTAIGLKGGWPSALMASEYMYISAGSEYIDVMKNKMRWVDSQKCLRGLQVFRSLVDNKLANEYVVGIDFNQARDLFFAGKVATILEGPWFIQQILTTKPDFEVGFFGLPPIDPKSDIQVLGGVGTSAMVIKKNDPDRENGAIKLIDFIISPEVASRKAKDLGEITPVDFPIIDDTSPLTKEIADAIKRYGDKVGYWPVYHLPAPLFRLLNSYIQGLMNGDLTPMQVLEKMDQSRKDFDAKQG